VAAQIAQAEPISFSGICNGTIAANSRHVFFALRIRVVTQVLHYILFITDQRCDVNAKILKNSIKINALIQI